MNKVLAMEENYIYLSKSDLTEAQFVCTSVRDLANSSYITMTTTEH